ncbi:MAG: hypothetical protein P8Y27_18900 [Chromatiaceae bacterium]|jgi:hypothetical protein
MTIDWREKVSELKRMAEELEMWASMADGRGRSGIGRVADELRSLVGQIEPLLEDAAPEPPAAAKQPLPDWLKQAGDPGGQEG